VVGDWYCRGTDLCPHNGFLVATRIATVTGCTAAGLAALAWAEAPPTLQGMHRGISATSNDHSFIIFWLIGICVACGSEERRSPSHQQKRGRGGDGKTKPSSVNIHHSAVVPCSCPVRGRMRGGPSGAVWVAVRPGERPLHAVAALSLLAATAVLLAGTLWPWSAPTPLCGLPSSPRTQPPPPPIPRGNRFSLES